MERKVTIEFTRPAGRFKPISWLVRLAEGTPYSHVRLKWETARGVPCVYEASGSGLHFKGPIVDKDSVVVCHSFDIPITQTEQAKMVDHCIRYAGVEYGYKQLIGILLVRFFGMETNPFSGGQICSEVVGRFLEEVLGWDTGLNLDIAGVKDIYNVLKGRQ